MTKKRAFTLIELLVVLAIIGVLMAYLVPKLGNFTDKAKSTTISSDLKSTFDNMIDLQTSTYKRLPTESEIATLLKDFNGGATVTFNNGTLDMPVVGRTYSRVARVLKNNASGSNAYYICIQDANTIHVVADTEKADKPCMTYEWSTTTKKVSMSVTTSLALGPPPPMYQVWAGFPVCRLFSLAEYPYQMVVYRYGNEALWHYYYASKVPITCYNGYISPTMASGNMLACSYTKATGVFSAPTQWYNGWTDRIVGDYVAEANCAVWDSYNSVYRATDNAPDSSTP